LRNESSKAQRLARLFEAFEARLGRDARDEDAQYAKLALLAHLAQAAPVPHVGPVSALLSPARRRRQRRRRGASVDAERTARHVRSILAAELSHLDEPWRREWSRALEEPSEDEDDELGDVLDDALRRALSGEDASENESPRAPPSPTRPALPVSPARGSRLQAAGGFAAAIPHLLAHFEAAERRDTGSERRAGETQARGGIGDGVSDGTGGGAQRRAWNAFADKLRASAAATFAGDKSVLALFAPYELVSEETLVEAALAALLGVSSPIFALESPEGDECPPTLRVRPRLCVRHLSAVALHSALAALARRVQQQQELAWLARQLSAARAGAAASMSGEGLAAALQTYLALWRAEVVAIDARLRSRCGRAPATLLQLSRRLRRPLAQIALVREMLDAPLRRLRAGAPLPAWELLSALYESARTCSVLPAGRADAAATTLHLFLGALLPYVEMLSRWASSGVVDDPHGEFLVRRCAVTEPRSLEEWRGEFVLAPARGGRLGGALAVPRFLEGVAPLVLRMGKAVQMLTRLDQVAADGAPFAAVDFAEPTLVALFCEAAARALRAAAPPATPRAPRRAAPSAPSTLAASDALSDALRASRSWLSLADTALSRESEAVEEAAAAAPPGWPRVRDVPDMSLEVGVAFAGPAPGDVAELAASMSAVLATADTASRASRLTLAVSALSPAALSPTRGASRLADAAIECTRRKEALLSELAALARAAVAARGAAREGEERESEAEAEADEGGPPAREAFVDVDELLRQCLFEPLSARYTRVGAQLHNALLLRCALREHMQALRAFYLMEDGELMTSVLLAFVQRVEEGESDPQALTSVVQEALRKNALCRHHLCQGRGVTVEVSERIAAVDRNSVQLLECFTFAFAPPWPLNVVITPEAIARYQRVLLHLLQLRRAQLALHRISVQSGEHRRLFASRLAHATFLARAEMLQFVTSVHEYALMRVVHHVWSKFSDKLDLRVALAGAADFVDVDELREHHAQYQELMLYQTLLHDRADVARNSVKAVLNLCLRMQAAFEGEVRPILLAEQGETVAAPEDDSAAGDAVSASDRSDAARGSRRAPSGALDAAARRGEQLLRAAPAALQRVETLRAEFRHAVRFLLTVLQSIVAQGFHPHLEDVLIRVNFNAFYRV
jgi:hypothetical protein